MSSRALRRICLLTPVCFNMSLATGCSDDGESSGTTVASASITDGDTSGASTDPGPTATGATTGATGDATGDSSGGDADDPAWMTPYCYTVADKKWLGPWIEREQQLLGLVNQVRAEGYDCGTTGKFAPAAPLELEARLHCAARRHSQDMAERDFFDHINPDGEDPFDRLAEAGYTSFAFAGENIAAGSADPAVTVQGWLDSDQHCANMMDSKYTQIGLGFYEGAGSYTYYWTQTLATPFQ